MVSGGRQFRVWFAIGLQSFGGGTTTMTLIRRAAVQQYGWITEEDFNRDWALCQMTPGINLIALSILIGRQVAGFRGAAVAVLGLLLPSATVTVLLTAAFVSIRDIPAVQSTLHGVLPASVGLGLVTAIQMAKKPLEASWKMGFWQLVFALGLLIGSGLLLLSGRVSVTVVLVLASAIGAAESSIRARINRGRATP